MKRFFYAAFFLLTALGVAYAQSDAPQPPDGSGQNGPPSGENGGPKQGRGVFGSVTAVTASSYTIQSRSGQSYLVTFTAETSIFAPQPPSRDNSSSGQRQGPPSESSGKALKATDVKVGDRIHVEGAIADGTITATRIAVLRKPPSGSGGAPSGPPPGDGGPSSAQ
jgi:hypothetical protein